MPTAQSLEPLERLALRDQLQDHWRANVEHLTELAVRYHSVDSDEDMPRGGDVVARLLVNSRLDLAEIEAAMRRLDVGRYGGCEACLRSIPFDDLVAAPARRRCTSCDFSEEKEAP
jgi:RNA polymerase-binding transcription factor DksA